MRKDERKKHFHFVLNHYMKYFSESTGNSWYATTIKSLIDSAVHYEQQKKEHNSLPIHLKIDALAKREVAPEFAIENQIGLIFVLCQTYISNIVKNVELFYKDYEFFSGSVFKKISCRKHELLRDYGKKISSAEYTEAQVINALANYYKHHEEWTFRKGQTRNHTIKIITDIGCNLELSFYWAQNLSNCIKLLEIQSFREMSQLLEKIDDWKFAIREAIPELNIQLPDEWYKLT